MRKLFLVPLFAFLTLIAGCDEAAMMDKLAPADSVAAARQTIGLLREGKYEQIEQQLDPSIRTPDIRNTLSAMAALIPRQEPLAVKLVGVQRFADLHGESLNLSFQYQFPDRWLMINVATRTQGAAATIYGFHVDPLPDSLENMNRFTLVGKTPLHYALLAWALAAPLFILYAVVVCARARPVRRKWLWIVFIVMGVGQVVLNWTTGEWRFNALFVQLLGSGMSAPAYGPWTLATSFPLGALVFLWKRRQLQAAGA